MRDILRELNSLRRMADGHIYLPDLKKIAKRVGVDQDLAGALWVCGDYAARHLALYVADREKITKALAEKWVRDLDDWAICDAFTANLIRPQDYAVAKAYEWARRKPLYQRRAGFSLLAQMAWQKNSHPDRVFADFLPLVEECANDDRLHVKKAVNWALRDIGKRNPSLAKKALVTARRLQKAEDKTARWVGTHRIREIENAHTGH